MRSRTPVSIFPFLSVLLSTMGVLSFLAVTFLLLTRQDIAEQSLQQPVEVRWVGAPSYVRPMLVECRKGVVKLHTRFGSPPRNFDVSSLEREVAVVRELLAKGYSRFGPAPSATQLWLYLKEVIPGERRLNNSLTRLLHEIEIDNLTGQARRNRTSRYPILLVYPDGIAAYQLVSFLVESTTRLSQGLEPMLNGWELPYQEQAS